MQKTLLLLLLSSALYTQCPCPPIDTCAPQNCAYLPPARRCVLPDNCLNNSDLYFSFDFLYWEGTERGLEFALNNTDSNSNRDIEISEPDFDFQPAFRITLGTHLPHDNWDLEFLYTRFYNHTRNHTQHAFADPLAVQTAGIQSVWTSSLAFQNNQFRALWQDVEAKWKIHANFFDLVLKHRLCMSPAITLEPTFGLKMALLQQNFSVLYENGNTIPLPAAPDLQFVSSQILMKNRSFNLGPVASLTTKWNFANHFDFLSTLSGSLLASHFNVARNEYDIDSSSGGSLFDSIRERDKYWVLRPQAGLSFGLGWSDCICRKDSVLHYGFSASYEAQIWWKQNMLFRFIDLTNAAMISPTQGNLFFHGLTLDGFIDF